MPAPDVATIQALRSDVALQIARFIRRRGFNQLAAAKRFDVPQPTLSKIVNGHIAGLSLELLIRIAVRAGLPVLLQTGQVPEEAGAFVSGERAPHATRTQSGVADGARASLVEHTQALSPGQRLAALLEHSQLVSALHRAGHATEAARGRKARRAR
jgi:predicted XRE-type DNA-binding protein